MKKILALLLLVIAAATLLCACGDPEPVYYTVEFDSDGAEKYTNRQILEGSLVVEPGNPTRGGYYFTGWYSDGKLWNFDTDTVEGNIKLVAGWKRITYRVTFDSQGGDVLVPEQLIPSGDQVTEPAQPSREGHRFLGWYSDGQLWNFASDPVIDNMVLTAAWEEITTYTVSFNSNGGTAVPSQTVVEGEMASFPANPTKMGHRFLGWYLGTEIYDFSNAVEANINLTAAWEEIVIPTHTVIFDSQGGSAVETQHPETGTAVSEPTAPTYPTSDTEIRAATFLGWYLGDVRYDFTAPVTANITLTAKWEIAVYYTVTFNAEGDAAYPQVFTLPKGDQLPVLRPSKDDYRFLGWYDDSGKLWNASADLPTSHLTLTARWEQIPTYRVVFDSKGGTEVSAQSVIEGGYISAPGEPTLENCRFDGWYDGDKKWDFNTMTVDGNKTLTAKWVEQVRVVFKDVGGTPYFEGLVDKGSLITQVAAPTKKNYRFDGWYHGEVKWDFEAMTADDHIEITPKWVRQYTVTFDTTYEHVIPSQTVDEGTVLSAPDTPQRGANFFFDGWYIKGTDTKWTFGDGGRAVTSDVDLVARWYITLPPHIFN